MKSNKITNKNELSCLQGDINLNFKQKDEGMSN